jgi:hypothetical protein
MIIGKVEFWISREVTGWVYEESDPAASITVRIREGETVLAQTQAASAALADPEQTIANHGRQSFCIKLSPPMDNLQRKRTVIEAAAEGSGSWCALSRPIWIGTPYLGEGPPLLANYKISTPPSGETPPMKSRPFWSEKEVAASSSEMESYPVFVVGAARSGTSAMAQALVKATRYQGFAEGHVLDIAIRVGNAVEQHLDRKSIWVKHKDRGGYHLGRMPNARFEAATLAFLRSLTADFTSPYWMDKTPTYQMVASVPVLADAWPNARFLFMKRRGLENVRSRLRKFKGQNPTFACKDWTLIMSGWRNVRSSITGRFLEVDQYDMATDPALTAERVSALLQLDPKEAEGLRDCLSGERPEATGVPQDIVGDVAELGWSDEDLNQFREICGPEMSAYGYTYDGRYRS